MMTPVVRGFARPVALIAALIAPTLIPGFVAEGAAQAPSGTARDVSFTSDSERGDLRAAEMSFVFAHTQQRLVDDLSVMGSFRPGFPFWRHIFTITDGSVAFGSATDGRLLAVFPARGEWSGNGSWEDASLASVLQGQRLPSNMTQRREQVAQLLEPLAGPVMHNATRGGFLLPNARRYGAFLEEWGAIYERFGVPAEIGLAQAVIESGLNGRIRSEAGALGFCQWLERNWNVMKRLSPTVIEGYNQTTQAPYCAAYLTILATKYGSFIPALSEHHAGGANVGRTVINGERLGGQDVRERYFLGAEFAMDLREIAPRRFSDIYRTYGPRSFLYAEMVFGNTMNVIELQTSIPQETIYAMRATRNIPIGDVTRRTGLSVDQVRRYNPALVNQVPRGANLYLPVLVEEFGPDVSFWHRPADREFASLLNEFVRLEATLDDWDAPSFEPVLRDFQRRFRETSTEEGNVMATVLAYVADEMYRSARPQILSEYRSNAQIRRLFEEGVREREASGLVRSVAR